MNPTHYSKQNTFVTGGALACLICFFFFSFPSASALTWNIDHTTVISNSTEYWITSLGSLGEANISQFESDGIGINKTLSINITWLDNFGGDLWCELTGCTMYGDLNLSNASITNTNYVQFNTLWDNGVGEGRLQWNIEDGTLEFGLPGGDVNMQIGQEMVLRVWNEEVVTINNGEVVYASSATGNIKKVKLANAANHTQSMKVVGVATEDIAPGSFGYITFAGLVRDFDTSNFSDGQVVYLDTVDGQIAGTPPIAPNTSVEIGIVVKPHATEGILYVRISSREYLTETSDVYSDGLINNSILQYSEDNSRFEMTTSPIFDNLEVKNNIVADNLYITGQISGGFIDKYNSSSNFNGSLYTLGANSSLSLSNSLFQVVSDTRGTPQFLIQDGGASQASLIVRSFLVVNQNDTLLNSSQNNLCSLWGFVHLDCNTSTTGADFGVTDDIEALGLIYADEGLRAHTTDHGAYLGIADKGYKYLGLNGIYNSTTNIFCDYTSNNFVDTGGWILITEEESDYIGAMADINAWINSSCIELRNNPAWNDDLNGTGVSWKVKDGVQMIAQKGGFFEYYVGEDRESQFKIKANNATGFASMYVDDIAGSDNHNSMAINTDSKNFDGVTGLNIFMSSSTEVSDIFSNAIKLEGDATGFNNSLLHFLDISLLGQGSGNDIDVISIEGLPSSGHIIHVGTPEEISKVYYDNTVSTNDITNAFISAGNNTNIFENDNSIIYIGNSGNFTSIGFSLETESSGNLLLEYSYCDSTNSWVILSGVSDTTNGMQTSGTISFINPIDRGTCNQEIDSTSFANTTSYTYVAIKRTRNNVVTSPVENIVTIAGGGDQFFLANDYMKLNPVDTAPEACDAGLLGGIYFDISEDNMCQCKSTGWKVIEDGSDCV